MDSMNGLLDGEIFGLELKAIAIALGVMIGSYLLMHGALSFAVSRLSALAARSKTRADDTVVEVLRGTSKWLMLLVAVLIGVSVLELSNRGEERLSHLWFVAVALQIGLWFSRGILIAQRSYEARHSTAGIARPTASGTLVAWAVRTVVWATVLLSMLANVGVNITAFVASLGVGGIAIALAVQNILGDLFASVSIAIDKPFEVGDGIGFGNVSGSVEYIGVKTTRLRAPSGEEVIVGNTDLLKQVVRNYKRMTERRIQFTFGLAHDTPPEVVEQIPALIKRTVESHEQLRFDRAHFTGVAESALNFEVVYFVRTADYLVYMDAHQALSLSLMRELRTLKANFAAPRRSVLLESGGPGQTPQNPPSGAAQVGPVSL